MKYKCLVLDHDDTIVNSSQSIHYPAFLHTLSQLRPNTQPLSFKEFNSHCFIYGFNHLCKTYYAFDEKEMAIEYTIWKSHTQSKQAQPFEGWDKLLNLFRQLGGKIVVVSYSESSEIIRDYNDHFRFTPDLIFAHDHGSDKLKPHPYPIYKVIEEFNISTHDIIVIDDMPVGYEMAKNANVDFVWAQWAYFDDILNNIILKSTHQSIQSVDELYSILEIEC